MRVKEKLKVDKAQLINISAIHNYKILPEREVKLPLDVFNYNDDKVM